MRMKRLSPPAEPGDLFFTPAAGGTDSHTSDVGHWLGMTARGETDPRTSDVGHWLGMTARGGTDSHTSDVGHWLGMTALRAGGGNGFFEGRNYISGRENDILGR